MIYQTLSEGLRYKAAATLAIALLRIVELVILARWLTPEAFGIYAIALTMAGIFQFFSDAGLSNALYYPTELPRTEATWLWNATFYAGLLITSIFLLSSFPLSEFFQMPQLREPLQLFSVVILAYAVGAIPRTLTHRQYKFRHTAAADTASQAIGVLVALIYGAIHPTVYALIYGHLIKTLLQSGLYLYFQYEIVQFYTPRKMVQHAPQMQFFLRYAAFQIPERVLGYLNSRMDIFFIARAWDSHLLGAYDLFKQFLRRPVQIVNPLLDSVWVPLMSRMHQRTHSAGKLYLLMVYLSALMLIPLYGALWLVHNDFIPLFFSAQWTPYSKIFALLCAFYVVHSVVQHIGAAWVAKARPDKALYWNAFVLTAQVPLFYALIHTNLFLFLQGYIAWMIAQGLLLYYWMLRPMFGLTLTAYLRSLWPPLGATGLALSTAALVRAIGDGSDALALTGYGLVIALVYALHLRRSTAVRKLLTTLRKEKSEKKRAV